MRFEMAHQVAVKLSSEDGTVGYGLTTPAPFYHGQTQGMMVSAVKHLLPFVEGQNLFNIELIHNTMDLALRDSEPAKCAIDLALYDLVGKILGQPAYALLGGKRQDSFVTTFTLASGKDRIWNAEEAAQETRRLYDSGYRAFEVHIGTAPGKGFHQDVQRIEAIRNAVGPEIDIDADVHRNWAVKEAIVGIRELEAYNIFIEQPVAGLEAMAEVRQQVGATIIADEDCRTIEDGVDIIRHKAADAFCIKPIKAGGLFKAKQLATFAEQFGLMTRVDGIPGEGMLSNTASAHLVLTLKHPIVCGVMQHARLEKDSVVDGGIQLTDGEVTLSQEPGLGVVVDESMFVKV